MPEFPSAYIHRIDGQTIAPPRRGHLPGVGLLRFIVGIWPATLTALAIASVVVTSAM